MTPTDNFYARLKFYLSFFKLFKNPQSILFSYITKRRGRIVLRDGRKLIFQKHDGKIQTLISYYLDNWEQFGWEIKINDNCFLFQNKNVKLLQPHVGGLTKDFYTSSSGSFKVFDYRDKIVLDVGGYFGETALLFLKWGAKKIIIYEPSDYNLYFLEINIKINNIPALIYPFAVTNKDGSELWHIDNYSIGKLDFGLRRGKNDILIRTKSWHNALLDAIYENVSIAKVNCEGGEEFLAEVNADIIKKIPCWIIQIHNKIIENKLLKKFDECGFYRLKTMGVEDKSTYKFWQ